MSDENAVITFASMHRVATALELSLNDEDIYEMLSLIESGTWNAFEAFCKQHEMFYREEGNMGWRRRGR